jgi:hypothetical protein
MQICFLISMYKYKYISMLNHIQRRFGQYMFSIERRLYIHDSGPEYDTFNESGIRATVFGASGKPGTDHRVSWARSCNSIRRNR